MTAAVSIFIAVPAATQPGVAFGNLIDLARLQTGTASAEICDACHTINMGVAKVCKCCSHKLPACYSTSSGEMLQVKQTGIVSAPALDFAAFWIVISLLVVITKFLPIP